MIKNYNFGVHREQWRREWASEGYKTRPKFQGTAYLVETSSPWSRKTALVDQFKCQANLPTSHKVNAPWQLCLPLAKFPFTTQRQRANVLALALAISIRSNRVESVQFIFNGHRHPVDWLRAYINSNMTKLGALASTIRWCLHTLFQYKATREHQRMPPKKFEARESLLTYVELITMILLGKVNILLRLTLLFL